MSNQEWGMIILKWLAGITCFVIAVNIIKFTIEDWISKRKQA